MVLQCSNNESVFCFSSGTYSSGSAPDADSKKGKLSPEHSYPLYCHYSFASPFFQVFLCSSIQLFQRRQRTVLYLLSPVSLSLIIVLHRSFKCSIIFEANVSAGNSLHLVLLFPALFITIFHETGKYYEPTNAGTAENGRCYCYCTDFYGVYIYAL